VAVDCLDSKQAIPSELKSIGGDHLDLEDPSKDQEGPDVQSPHSIDPHPVASATVRGIHNKLHSFLEEFLEIKLPFGKARTIVSQHQREPPDKPHLLSQRIQP